MRIARKSKEHLKQGFLHYLNGEFYQFCLDAHYYGEFDFFLDMCLFLQRHYTSEFMQSSTYEHMVDIYFDKEYNKNLLNPNSGEPRFDKYGWALEEAPDRSFNLKDIFNDKTSQA